MGEFVLLYRDTVPNIDLLIVECLHHRSWGGPNVKGQ